MTGATTSFKNSERQNRYVVCGAEGVDGLVEQITECWDDAEIFDISGITVENIQEFYEQVASRLGVIRAGYSANNLDTKFALSRDIKPTTAAEHFFSATTRQPLHTDMAYVPADEAGDWLILYCMQPSDFGGNTRAITVKTLREIMSTYAPDLLADIQIDVMWKYEKEDGAIVHSKPILAGDSINWNYWQIDREANDPDVLETCRRFFDFLEAKIENGNIYDYSKRWAVGDALLINEKKALHGRDAFLGDRWLKDHIFTRRR